MVKIVIQQKKLTEKVSLLSVCGEERTRTADLLTASQAL